MEANRQNSLYLIKKLEFYYESYSLYPYSKITEKNWKKFDDYNQNHLYDKYQLFEKNPQNSICSLIDQLSNCAVCFDKMEIYDFETKNLFKIKKVEKKGNVDERKTQENINEPIQERKRHYIDYSRNIRYDFLDSKIIKGQNDFNLFTDLLKQNQKESIKIKYKVFDEFPCTIEIDKELCNFENDITIEDSLETMKSNLITEIKKLGEEEGEGDFRRNTMKNIYEENIEKIIDHKTFFETMVFIYTIEGYLYKKLNNYLRENNKLEFEKIKIYCISLLASFQFLSQNNTLNQDEDMVVYRASRCSDEELQKFQNSPKIFPLFKEFLSTTKDCKVARELIEKDDNKDLNYKKIFWEITIPKFLIKNESHNFADISKHSQYKNESEILIRNGAIIETKSIRPYLENERNKENRNSGIVKITCTLRSFSNCFRNKLNQIISIDPSINEFNFEKININEENTQYLRGAFENNTTITCLDLESKNLGEIENSMLYIKNFLKYNDSVKILNLSKNNLGKKESDMQYLKEILSNNCSIKELNLKSNNLGSNKKNILNLKEALLNNNSIQILNISFNNLNEHSEENLQNLKEALINNKSITDLNISNNRIDFYVENKLMEIIKKNKK